MTAPAAFALAVVGIIVSAYVRLNAVVCGHPVSVPVLGIVAVAVVLLLAAVVLLLIRSIVRDGAFMYRVATT